MTLKEKVLNRKNIEYATDIKSEKQYDDFLTICERLQKTIDLSNIDCNSYADVFLLIEKYNINITDIISDEKYEDFKNDMINDKAQCCPILGKRSKILYDSNNENDMINYLKNHGGGSF